MTQTYTKSPAPSSLALTSNRKRILVTTEAGITVTGTVGPFTGAHEVSNPSGVSRVNASSLQGRVASSTGSCGSVTISEAIPNVRLSVVPRDTSVYGVFVVGDKLTVNGIGEGGMWVCDANGAIFNGDYVTTSSAAGYGMRQDEEWQCAHTVAKSFFECDFTEEVTPASAEDEPAGDAGTEEEPMMSASAEEEEPSAVEDQPAMAAGSEEPIEELFTPGAAEAAVPATPPVPTYHGRTHETSYEMRYLVQAEADPATGDNVRVVTREEYEQTKLEGGTAWRAAFIGCSYHCG